MDDTVTLTDIYIRGIGDGIVWYQRIGDGEFRLVSETAPIIFGDQVIWAKCSSVLTPEECAVFERSRERVRGETMSSKTRARRRSVTQRLRSEGAAAYKKGLPPASNPYNPSNANDAIQWERGYLEAEAKTSRAATP